MTVLLFFFFLFFLMIENMFWAMPFWRLCANFWSNTLTSFCNAVFSRRIRSSVLPQRLHYCITQQCFHIQYHVWSKTFKWKIVSEYLFSRNIYKHKNYTMKNLFLHAFGFCLLKPKRISLGICLSKSIFSPAYEMTGYTKCPNINFCGMSVYSSVNLQWIFWFSISLSQTAGKLNFSNRHQFTALNACSALQDILIIFFSAKWQIPFSWQ